MKPLIEIEPIDAARCDAKWIARRREIIARFRFPVRDGEGNTIELRSITPFEHLSEHDRLKMNPWVPLILPDNAPCFTTAADRDAVLQQLQQPIIQ